MSYRKTRRSQEQLARMRAVRDANRMAKPAEARAPDLPNLRRRIVIEDFDFGHHVHVLELYRTNRVDCYRVVSDGVEWKKRIGWSRILSGLRKSLPRVSAAMD